MADDDRTFAVEYIADRRFHRVFTLPANPGAGRTTPLRVTYSDAGSTAQDAPVVLVCGGMLGGRWVGLGAANVVGTEKGVRVICVDRPGTGGSTRVQKNRVAIWLELVPSLLAHLSIPHVALVSASAGSIYLINTLLSLRHILHPTRPYVALLVPWVTPNHSGMTTMTLATLIPEIAVSNFHNVIAFVNNRVKPVTGFSGGFLKSIFKTADLPSQAPARKKGDPINQEMLDQIFGLVMKYMFAEDTSGGSQDTLLCLKKGGEKLWGGFEEYHDAVPVLAAAEDRLQLERKLKVDVFHASDDSMVGVKGQRYFDRCWDVERSGGSIEYRSRVVEDSDHDSIGNMDKGAIGAIFDEVVKSFSLS